jgi:dihydrodipicolinate synthase/N-acetylneuraminate lyase
MKTSAVTPDDLIASIMALPPLARAPDGRVSVAENEKLVNWLSSAGVTTFLYGGCANFFNIGLREFSDVLDLIERIAPPKTWVVPSIGPDFGKAMDQIDILRDRDFPTAMILPFAPVTHTGVATGLRRLSDAYGRPIMLFLKSADYISPTDAARLLADGVLCTVEYGLSPPDLANDPYLAELLDAAGTAAWIVDGSGEKTVVARHAPYGIVGFSSGSGVVGPHLAMALLHALKRGDLALAESLRTEFLPLEALRQRHSPIPVLHDAVALADIAATGPIGPFFSNIADPGILAAIREAAHALRAASQARDVP